jgi:transcriptional regulator with XRE-family HTH domain
MDFSQVVQQIRNELGFDLRTFAELTGVDATTISRIENAKAQVTLSTAVQICEKNGISPTKLYSDLLGKQVLVLEQREPALDKVMPTERDAQTLIFQFRKNRHQCALYLTRILNRIASLSNRSNQLNLNGDELQFVPESFTQLLLDAPFYRFELQYPADLKAETIWELYCDGGLLTLIDIGAYIKIVRRQRQVTLVRLENSVKISTSVLSHLETGSIERIRLADVLSIDAQLEQRGKLLAMYWSVSKFNNGLRHVLIDRTPRRRWSDINEIGDDLKVITLFTIMCRWMQVLSQQETSWIREIRKELHHLNNLASVTEGERLH